MNTSLGNFELFSDWLFCCNYRMWQHHRMISGVILRIQYWLSFWKYVPTKLQMKMWMNVQVHPHDTMSKWKIIEWMSKFENLMRNDHDDGVYRKLSSIKEKIHRNVDCCC